MKALILFILALVAVAPPVAAQGTRVTMSGGDVALTDASRLATRIPGMDAELRARVRVTGDSAQRIALDDFHWKGRVSSVEIDEEDARTYWDVKIVPDSSHQTIIRYRVDALSGGIMSIKEFSGVRGLAKRKPR
jgi:uncharacterized membrane protein YkoI